MSATRLSSALEKHPFEPDVLTDGATCLRCGMEFTFGSLHPIPTDDAEDGYELPQICGRCWHIEHQPGSCGAFIPSGMRSVACRCGSAA